MYPPQKTPAKSILDKAREYLRSSGIFAGCVTGTVIIGFGRTYLSLTTSTMFGWTALFFFALFAGMLVANFRSRLPFAGSLQTIGLMTGCATSLGALVSMQYTQGSSASDVLLGVSLILLLPSLLGIKPTDPMKDYARDHALVDWALRLDDLMKYELPQSVKAQITNLIDTLWSSPPNSSDYIPAQNMQFDLMLTQLENAIKTNLSSDLISLVTALTQCLNERNYLINGHVEIEYQNITQTKLLADATTQSSNRNHDL